jgi:hypothetical protein
VLIWTEADTLTPGAHSLAPYARTGVPRAQVPWSAGVTYRLETDLSLEEAIRVAESLEPIR